MTGSPFEFLVLEDRKKMKISGMIKRFLMVGVLLLATLSAYAQNNFTVKVKLVDDKTDYILVTAFDHVTKIYGNRRNYLCGSDC